MGRHRTLVLSAALSFSLAVGSLPAQAASYADDDEPDAGDMLADAVVVRPLTFIAGLVGGALWVVSLPFTIPGGNAGEVADKAFTGPMRYTFYRPLGHMGIDDRPAYAEQSAE